MKSSIQRLAVATVMFVSMLFLTLATGCRNTAHGVGEDVERMGEGIQRKVD